MKLGVIAEPDRSPDSPDTVVVVEPSALVVVFDVDPLLFGDESEAASPEPLAPCAW